MNKIAADHLARGVCVYIRQSTPTSHVAPTQKRTPLDTFVRIRVDSAS